MPYTPTWQYPYPTPTFGNGYSQTMQPTVSPTYQPPVNGIVKVNGRDSALQYTLPPNSMSPALFDNDGRTFYIVSTDGTGMKTVEAFDYQPHVDQTVQHSDSYVSRTEFEALAAKVEAMMGVSNGVHAAVPATTADHAGTNGNAAVNAER